MSDESKYVGLASTTAAIASIANLFKTQKVAAAGGFPPELAELFLAMAADINLVAQFVADYNPPPGTPGSQIINAVTPSYQTVRSVRVDIPVPGTSVRLPDIPIPPGIQVKIKAGWNNVGVVYIAGSGADAINPYATETLIRNEFTSYFIANPSSLYASGTVAGDYITVTTEAP